MNILTNPIKIRNLELNNRLVMPPMATVKLNDDGKVTQQLCDYYDERAKGNYIGLIIIEHSYINLAGKAGKGQISISQDSDIEGLNKLVSSIHKSGNKVMAQLNHAGGVAKSGIYDGQNISASSVRIPSKYGEYPIPKEMSYYDIKNLIDDFVKAAIRAKKAGFDGIELHSAHGYLLNQFYSPLTNKRKDKYNGSSIEGRIRLHLDIVQAIRKSVGDYPIAIRLGACDYMDGGSSINDSIKAAKIFEEAGVDLLDISGGFCGYINPNIKEQGYFSEITEAIKKNTSIPIILTGGIKNVDIAEELLKNKKADMIGVGRVMLKDARWAEKSINSLI